MHSPAHHLARTLPGPCPLTHYPPNPIPPYPQLGDSGYISDLIALHTVGCVMDPQQLGEGAAAPGSRCGCGSPAAAPGPAGTWRTQGGVTLHLYSPPIHRVKIYEHNTVTERTPGFYSKGGVRV